MGDSLITVVAIVLAAILMFIFPLMSVSERGDDVAQLAVQSSTTEFVDKIRSSGKITLDGYDKFVQTISATGNKYEVELEVKVLDENPGKKTTQSEYTKIGENVYYTQYTTQIMETLHKNKTMSLKEGDIMSVNVKNTNMTLSQTLRNFFYKVSGNSTYQIGASHSGFVTVNGK